MAVVGAHDVRTDNSSNPGGSGASSWENQQRGESHTDQGEPKSHHDGGRRDRIEAPASSPVDETDKKWTRTSGLIDVKA